jgi:DNA-binding beta-propeller fold protein YncE
LDNLAFDNRGWLYVSNNDLGWVGRVLPNGKVRQIIPGGMTVPGGVAVLPATGKLERVLVGNFFSLHEFNGRTGQPLSVAHSFADMLTVAPDGNHLVTSSWFTNSVKVWDPQTQQTLEAHYDFAVPLNAIRFQGDLVVAELLTGRVVRRNSTSGDTTLAALAVPTGLAATDNDLWVSDWFLGMVWQVVKDGNPVMIPVAIGLAFPEGLAVDADGHLLVVEAGAGRLSRIDPTTGAVTHLVEGLELGGWGTPTMPPTWVFNGVAVGPSGAIYVTGDVANVLYRIDE